MSGRSASPSLGWAGRGGYSGNSQDGLVQRLGDLDEPSGIMLISVSTRTREANRQRSRVTRRAGRAWLGAMLTAHLQLVRVLGDRAHNWMVSGDKHEPALRDLMDSLCEHSTQQSDTGLVTRLMKKTRMSLRAPLTLSQIRARVAGELRARDTKVTRVSAEGRVSTS